MPDPPIGATAGFLRIGGIIPHGVRQPLSGGGRNLHFEGATKFLRFSRRHSDIPAAGLPAAVDERTPGPVVCRHHGRRSAGSCRDLDIRAPGYDSGCRTPDGRDGGYGGCGRPGRPSLQTGLKATGRQMDLLAGLQLRLCWYPAPLITAYGRPYSCGYTGYGCILGQIRHGGAMAVHPGSRSTRHPVTNLRRRRWRPADVSDNRRPGTRLPSAHLRPPTVSMNSRQITHEGQAWTFSDYGRD